MTSIQTIINNRAGNLVGRHLGLDATEVAKRQAIGTNWAIEQEMLTPLERAYSMGDIEVMGILLKRGADPNEGKFLPPIMWSFFSASEVSHDALALLLLYPSLDVNVIIDGIITPLIYATYSVDIKAVRSLLLRGANVNLKNNEGLTAWDYTCVNPGRDTEKIQKLLNSRN